MHAFTAVVAPGRQASWHRVGDDAGIAPDDQIAIEARHRSEASLDGRGREPRLTVGDPHHVLGARSGLALRRHEAQDVSRGHVGGFLADHPEEDAQVVGIGPHRVRPRPARGELQELIDQLVANSVLTTTVCS